MPTVFQVGVTTDPPEAASYQVTPVELLNTDRASSVCSGFFSHSVIEDWVTAGGTGAGVLVKVTGVLVALEQVPFEYSA